MKKIITLLLLGSMLTLAFTGCNAEAGGKFDAKKQINVVSREDGSGTRGAFIELFEILEKDDNGNKKDMTTKEAIIAGKTDVLLTNVSSDTYAIGYVSLGSLGQTVKAVDIDGVKPSIAAVKDGTYKASRPFNIATKGDVSKATQDFIDFILSKDGQTVVSKSYITVDDNALPYNGSAPAGKVTVVGSSSVSPIMEKLKEAYEKVNTNAVIEIQSSDSTAGMTSAIDGTCDIGMASRALKDSEKEKLSATAIAIDGIAVIVHNDNPTTALSSEQVKAIYTGKSTKWNQLNK